MASGRVVRDLTPSMLAAELHGMSRRSEPARTDEPVRLAIGEASEFKDYGPITHIEVLNGVPYLIVDLDEA
jgi:hypothetical protein